MAGFNTGSPVHSKTKNKYLKHSDKGVKIDMTPMVDVIMLLLTFFMLTSVLTKPQVMTVNLPKSEKEIVKFDMGNALFLRTSPAGKIIISTGNSNGTENFPQIVETASLKSTLEELYKANSDYVMLIKFDRGMKYTAMVDILDEINTANISRRYVFKPIEDEDKRVVSSAGG